MRIAACMVLALAPATIAFGDTQLRGTVTDVNGGAISGAMVLLHWDPAGSTVGFHSNVGIKKDLVLETDNNGSFAAELPPGFYDLFVSAAAFTPACRKIRMSGTARPDVTVRLEVDPLVSKELGDTFETVPPKP